MISHPTWRQNPQVLLVSHNFPPVVGPESYLVYLNAVSLHRAGFQVTVLTSSHEFKHTKQQYDSALLDALPSAIKVLRTVSYDAWFKAKFPRVGGVALQAMERTFLPESYMMWLPSSYRRGRRHLAENPSIIYSRAQKHVSNVCGWRLKRTTGLPWVAHFSDPWSMHLKAPLARCLAKIFERRILRDADKVVFVTQKTADVVMRQYPEAWQKKINIIPHGYAKEVSAPNPIHGPSSGPLRLLHAGAFYPGQRTPETLFKALRVLHNKRSLEGRLSLTLLGGENENYRGMAQSLGLAGLVSFEPSVSLSECHRLLDECDLPVMIDTLGCEGIFLPSKLIEYFAFQKPVLGITEPASAVSRVLKDCGLPVADQTDAAQIAGVLEDFLQQWELGTWGLPASVKEKMASYQIDRVNQPLFEILEGLQQQVRAVR
ncbi:glycosyltransferase [Prosthecobacter sp. SYSU 5D2]|uniref:glycosyltransferase n=1 Tax=Prosthecobacter sp. SYSU 5D2 TaxID=3134134 RepID=UPI0031FE6121